MMGAAVLLLLSALLLVLLGFTTVGARLLAHVAESNAPVRSESIEGTLWSGVSIKSVQADFEGTRLVLEEFRVVPRWSCLLAGSFCFEELSALQVHVQLREAATDNQTPLNVALPALPALTVDRLHVDVLEVQSGAETFLAGPIQSQLVTEEFGVQIDNASLEYRGFSLSGGAQFRNDSGLEARLFVNTTAVAGLESTPALQGDFIVALDGDADQLEARIEKQAGGALELSLLIENLVAQEPLRFEGSLLGLAAVLPPIESLELKPVGSLTFAGEMDGDDASLQLQQELDALNRSAELSLNLSKSGDHVQLISGQWGSEGAKLMEAQGSLGTLSAIVPELNIRLTGFPVHELSDGRIDVATGELLISVDIDAPLQSWRLHSKALQLEGEQVEIALTMDLRADRDTGVLPSGNATGMLGERRLAYRREMGEAAYLELPEGISLGDTELSAGSLRVQPVTDGADLQLRLSGDFSSVIDLSLRENGEEFSLVSQPFVVTFQEQDVESASSIQLFWDKRSRALRLDPFCLSYRESAACTEALEMQDAGELNVDLDLKDSFTIRRDAQVFSFSSIGTGRLQLRWAERELERLSIEALLSPISVIAQADGMPSRTLTWESGSLEASWSPDSRAAMLSMRSKENGQLDVQLGETGESLSGSMRLGDFDIATLSDLLPSIEGLQGQFGASFDVSGTRKHPIFVGGASLQGATGVVRGTEMSFSDGDLSLLGENEAYVFEGKARIGDGQLKLSGVCCENDKAEATLSGNRLNVHLPSGVSATLSPQLFLTADPKLLDLSGVLLVHDGVLEHGGPREEGVALSRDIVLTRDDAGRDTDFSVLADIQTIIEPGFTLRSKELEATLSGDLRVSLRPRQTPELFGDLQVLGGELRVYGQALRLAQGSVGFIGDPYNPELNVSAEREIRAERLRVGFKVLGSLDEPRLEMFSDPQRSERETLSYLLRGRGPDAGAAADGTALALSLGASALNQSGALSSLNAIPGLSGVSLGAEGTEDDVAATISAYVGRRLYLSYGVGIYEPVNALTARLYLRSRLWLEVVSRLESSFDLYYRFDRD